MNRELKKIEYNIENLTINGKNIPKTIIEFYELSEFKNFEDLKSSIHDKSYSLLTPNNLLYQNFEYISTRQNKLIDSLANYLPLFLAILLTIFCFKNENYFGIILLPLTFISRFISAFFKNYFFFLILFILGIYLLTNEKTLFGSAIIVFSFTMISSLLFKFNRRRCFHNSAMKSEKIFSFLFYARNISLINNYNNKIIKSI